MEPYEALTTDITAGPRGNSIAAFFDLDGTIIATHSVTDLFVERLVTGKVQTEEIFDMASMAIKYLLKSQDFEDGLRSSVANMQGMEENELIELTEKVTRERLMPQVFPEIKAMIRAHRKQGHTLVVVTSATRYQVGPLARELGIDHVICTELEVQDGRFTGRLAGPASYGRAKLRAARKFAGDNGVALEQSWFYSNGSEDLPLLDAVGHPVAIAPDSRLKKVAERRGWPVHAFDSRGWVGVTDIARTFATFGTALPTFAAGLPFRLLGGTERDSTNLSIAAWAGMASIISGLKLIVDGEEHLWSHRPAIFLFNHQSAMDMLVCAKLLREDIVGIAKTEIQRQPLVGPVLKLAGTVFVDRENVRDPKEALKPAVDALAEGKSIVIAPEGTRSRTGRLGEFKRGAFHLAQQSGAPIVPIVIHNAVDALPSRSMIIRPAEVKVTVLAPIITEKWTPGSVARQAKKIREAFLDVLGESAPSTQGGSGRANVS